MEPRGLCVLLAVAAEASAGAFAEALAQNGHEVCSAPDARAALATARERQPDVVVVSPDVTGGADLPAALRTQVAWRRPFVVALAEPGDPGPADADLVVAKPASVGRLLQVLRRLRDITAGLRAFDPVI